ncbi:MAG TPA: hypothetical protein EYP68_00390 [Candidatus Korarchaeota archaeon]|nr:hypothetical protein [Candidatus Korarchaeota archaeon]
MRYNPTNLRVKISPTNFRMIHEELIEIAKPVLAGKKVKDLVVGLKYTAVFLDDLKLGLAFTLRGPFMTKEWLEISTKDPIELSTLLASTSPIEASIGLATINAASQIIASKERLCPSKSLLEVLELGKEDQILLVGLMVPLAWEFCDHVSKIWAVEDSFSVREGPPNLEVRPWWALDLILRREKISALIVSGSAITNKTIDHILELSDEIGLKVALVGPSVPIFSHFWRKKGISVLAASLIKKPSLALRLIKMGFGSKELFRSGCLAKILIELEED